MLEKPTNANAGSGAPRVSPSSRAHAELRIRSCEAIFHFIRSVAPVPSTTQLTAFRWNCLSPTPSSNVSKNIKPTNTTSMDR